jgi:tungstate transport system substrate-binding protein
MNKQAHSILYENSPELANTYGIILINPNHCPRMNYPDSLSLYNWLVSEDAKKHISDFTINGSQVFYVD